jgi:glycosyltransferase involved in cell wall biosynthesis
VPDGASDHGPLHAITRLSRSAEGPLRVLHVLAPAVRGGLETVVRGLAHGLVGRGHRVTVAAVVEPGRPQPFLLEAAGGGVDLRAMELPKRAYRDERRAIAELIAELDADVLHTHGYRPDVLHHGVARHAGVPVVSTVHGFTGGDWKNRLYERVQVRALRRFDAVVVVSEALRDRLRRGGVAPARLHLVPNAWIGSAPLSRTEARSQLGLPEDDVVVGWVGRLSVEKGPDLAVRALAELPGEVSLSFVGEGPERPAAERLARDLGVGDRIRWHGPVAEAAALLSAFDAVLLSSRTEGTPMVLLEAMAAGVPVVATAVGGIPAAMLPGAGMLAAPGSSRALAEAVSAVLAPGACRPGRAEVEQALGQGRARWLEQYESIYRSVVGARR